jgi:hypothetical protein
MRVPSLVVVLVSLACTTPAAAQLSSLEPGDRVRVRLESKERLTGDVVSATPDSLTLRVHPQATPTTLPSTALRSVEVSLGTPSTWTSALNSAVLGAGLLGSQLALSEGAEGRELGKHAGWGATLGAAVGLAVGAIFREERWSPVSLPQGSADRAEALRFPAVAIAGRWGPAGGQAGEGKGRGARLDVGVARLGDDTQLRAEISFERSTLRSGPVAYSPELGIISSHEENRRYSYGLTVVENGWRIGERFQTYDHAPFACSHARKNVLAVAADGMHGSQDLDGLS